MSTYDGNSFAYICEREREQEEHICPCCDCKDRHSCLNCNETIVKEEHCFEQDGLCWRCFREYKNELLADKLMSK